MELKVLRLAANLYWLQTTEGRLLIDTGLPRGRQPQKLLQLLEGVEPAGLRPPARVSLSDQANLAAGHAGTGVGRPNRQRLPRHPRISIAPGSGRRPDLGPRGGPPFRPYPGFDWPFGRRG